MNRRKFTKITAMGVVGTRISDPLYGSYTKDTELFLRSITEYAKLSLNCLDKFCDRSRGQIPYFYTEFNRSPLYAGHQIWSYGDGLGRTVDALVLLRHMLGQNIDLPDDNIKQTTLISFISPDGLSWCPAEPWTLSVPHTRPAWLQQGTLLALTSLYLSTKNEYYKKLAENNIDGIIKLARFNDKGYAEFPGDYFTLAHGWSELSKDKMHRPSIFYTSVTMPLMRFYRATAYEPALKLASALIKWTLTDNNDVAGMFELGHFHSQSRLITALLLRAKATCSKEDIDKAEELYLKAKKLGTDSGWFPEQINNPEHNRSNLAETCCLTDMLEAAILLAQLKDNSYWNDVERFAKNHLYAFQISDTSWFGLTDQKSHVLPYEPILKSNEIRELIKGGFAGWGAVTAMSDDSPFANANQQCCNAAGARALYDVWKYAVSDNGTDFRVNIHIHRKHKCAEIIMKEGTRGTLTITSRTERHCWIRLPENLKISEVKTSVNNRHFHPEVKDGFLDFGKLKINDVAKLEYPMKNYVKEEHLAAGDFRFTYHGSTVVEAEPIQKFWEYFTNKRFTSEPPVFEESKMEEIDSL
jgi:hypothetical protein